MQQINLGMLLRVIGDLPGDAIANRGVGIIQVRIDRDAAPKLSFSVDLREPVDFFKWNGAGIGLIPAFAGQSERRRRPAVADALKAQTAIRDGGFDAGNVTKENRVIKWFCRQISALGLSVDSMLIPPLKERRAKPKLNEVAV